MVCSSSMDEVGDRIGIGIGDGIGIGNGRGRGRRRWRRCGIRKLGESGRGVTAWIGHYNTDNNNNNNNRRRLSIMIPQASTQSLPWQR